MEIRNLVQNLANLTNWEVQIISTWSSTWLWQRTTFNKNWNIFVMSFLVYTAEVIGFDKISPNRLISISEPVDMLPQTCNVCKIQYQTTTRIEPVGKPYREVCLRSELWPWMGPSTEFLVETSRDADWTDLGLLSRGTEVCRVYWAIILSPCDHDIWRTDLKIHRVDGRDTVYIPAKFHRNPFKNKREISVQHIFQGCLLVTLTFNLRPWNLHQVVSLSRTINQLNLKTMGW